MNRVLVISPHPDDESIGCGGALLQHTHGGDAVRIVFLTSGENGRKGSDPAETAQVREQEAKAAAEILGASEIEFWREPDGSITVTPGLVERLRDVLQSWQPDVLYVTHADEMHPDHRAAASLVRQAMDLHERPCQVWMYEVWTPLQVMDHIIDITPFIDSKLAAIRTHRTQCDAVRFDDAMLGLARYRGEMHSWPGGPYAEVFREGHK
jgi:LmbE family N-acetylglucosaminyl deacetylase